jgi:hypothetical protein
MGFRFYRRIRIAPGLTLNLSKRGTSVSVGERGAHVTLGSHGTRETVGIPGTGVGYTATQRGHRRRRAAKHGSAAGGVLFLLFLAYILIYMALHALGLIGG